jgi:hypothetical protein
MERRERVDEAGGAMARDHHAREGAGFAAGANGFASRRALSAPIIATKFSSVSALNALTAWTSPCASASATGRGSEWGRTRR